MQGTSTLAAPRSLSRHNKPPRRYAAPMSPRSRPRLVAPLALLVACAPPPLVGGDDPSVEILFPVSDESLVFCPEMIVVVAIEGYALDPDSVGGAPVEGSGHWHLLDSNAHLGTSTDEYFALEGKLALTAGRHFFTAELVTNDHQSLDIPIVSDLVEFNVDEVEGCLGGATTTPNEPTTTNELL